MHYISTLLYLSNSQVPNSQCPEINVLIDRFTAIPTIMLTHFSEPIM